MPVCKSAVCVCRGINRHRVYGNLRSGVIIIIIIIIIIIFCCFIASLAREEKKNYAPINVMPAGAGEAGHGGGDLTFSKIFNQMPCPRANQSSQNNNLGHKGGPSKNSFVKRAGHHILQEQLTGATRRIPPVPSPPLKMNGPLPTPILHSSSTSPVLEC